MALYYAIVDVKESAILINVETGQLEIYEKEYDALRSLSACNLKGCAVIEVDIKKSKATDANPSTVTK